MDKYAAYVIVVYVVTFVLLAAYLGWMWWKLRGNRKEGPR